MYSIRFDAEHDVLDIIWGVQFSPAAVAAYAADLRQQFGAQGFRPGYRLRIDMSLSAIQTQAAIESFAQAFVGFPLASRIAIVTPSALAALQVRRVMRQPYLQVFRRADQAWDWLVAADNA